MRVYGTGHDTTIDQPPTTPKDNRSRNSRSHDQITRGGALIPHHHHAQPTNHTHSQTERKRKSAPRAEGTNSTYRPGRPSGDGQSERARSNPTTDGRRDSERSRQHNAIYDRIYIILGVARPVGERKEEMDVRPPDFSWGFFFRNGSGILQRETNRGLAAGCLIYMPFISYHFFSGLVWHERKKDDGENISGLTATWDGWMDGAGLALFALDVLLVLLLLLGAIHSSPGVFVSARHGRFEARPSNG